MSGDIYDSVKRSIVPTSTFGENSLAMRAGLAALDVLEYERLGQRATQLGELFRDWGMLTQMSGNNFMVLKAAPPLTVNQGQIGCFVEAIGAVVETMYAGAFRTEALWLARRAVNV